MTGTTNHQIQVDFLYLDLGHCTRCAGTKVALDQAIEAARPALASLGHDVALNRTHVQSVAQARALQFSASPTIRINGEDLQPEAHMSRCVECGELCNCEGGIDCRVWQWDNERTLTPPVGMIVDGLMRAALRTPATTAATVSEPAANPSGDDSIARFFENADKSRCCPTDCCR